MNLLEHLVDVNAVGLLPPALLLLVALCNGLLSLAGLFGCLTRRLGWHVCGTTTCDAQKVLAQTRADTRISKYLCEAGCNPTVQVTQSLNSHWSTVARSVSAAGYIIPHEVGCGVANISRALKVVVGLYSNLHNVWTW